MGFGQTAVPWQRLLGYPRFDRHMTATITPATASERISEFQSLFAEFAATYLKTEEGLDHIHLYEPERAAAKSAYADLSSRSDAGNLETDQVLLKLLPWTDSEANRNRGAWISVAPAITGDIKSWFEKAGWAKREDWPQISQAILKFVRTCVEDPTNLEEPKRPTSRLPGAEPGWMERDQRILRLHA